MPNHCTNSLVVEGHGDYPRSVRQQRLLKFARDHYRKPSAWDGGTEEHKSILDFSSSVPYPEDMEERQRMASSSDSGWYMWRVANWGTKWGPYDVSPETIEEVIEACQGDTLQYSFDTAWSPPDVWLLTASRKYPHLTFTLSFVEYGCDFAGKVKVVDGQLTTLEDFAPSDLVNSHPKYMMTKLETMVAEMGPWERLNM